MGNTTEATAEQDDLQELEDVSGNICFCAVFHVYRSAAGPCMLVGRS